MGVYGEEYKICRGYFFDCNVADFFSFSISIIIIVINYILRIVLIRFVNYIG